MKKVTRTPTWRLVSFICFSLIVIGCSQPAPEKKPEERQKPRHVYKELKPEVFPVPEGVKKALPGLLNDNIYLYREIAPTLNLVAYVPQYSREGAVRMAAQAFLALSEVPELREDIEFWIIQVQPEAGAGEIPIKESEAGEQRPDSRVVVWGVRPEEVDAYKQSKDLAAFIKTSEYLLVDDQIISRGKDRLDQFPALIPPPIQPGDTTGEQAPEEEPETESPPKSDTKTGE